MTHNWLFFFNAWAIVVHCAAFYCWPIHFVLEYGSTYFHFTFIFVFNIQERWPFPNHTQKGRTRCELEFIKYLAVARVFKKTDLKTLFLKLEYDKILPSLVTALLMQVKHKLSENQMFSVMQLTTKIKMTLKCIWACFFSRKLHTI